MPILHTLKGNAAQIAMFSDEVAWVRLLRSQTPHAVSAMFTFTVDVREALASGCQTASVTVYESLPPKEKLQISRSIVAQQAAYLNFVQAGFTSPEPPSVFSTDIDITSRIDNTKIGSGDYSAVRRVVRGASPAAVVAYNRKKRNYSGNRNSYASYLASVAGLNETNSSYFLQSFAYDESSLVLGHAIPIRQGLHPYQVAALSGVRVPLAPVEAVSYPQLQTELSSLLDVSFLASINKRSLKGTTVVVSIKMKDKLGNVLQTITRPVNIKLLTQIIDPIFTPRPRVTICLQAESRLARAGHRIVVSSGDTQDVFYRTSPRSQFSKLTLQHAPLKNLVSHARQFLGPAPIPSKQYTSLQHISSVQQPSNRAPQSVFNLPNLPGYLEVRTTNSTGGYSTSRVVDTRRSAAEGFVHAYQESGCVTVRLYDVDLPRHSSVVFFERNLTTRAAPRPISGHIIVRDTTDVKNIFAIQRSFMPGHVYEYYARLYSRNGASTVTRTDTIAAYNFNTIIYPVVSNKVVSFHSGQTPQVTFDLSVTRPESISNDLLNVLRSAGLEDYFKTSLNSNLERFSEMVSFSVHRYDVTSGIRYDLGNVYNGKFNDELQSKKYSAPSLSRGHSYLYEVRPSLSSPLIVMNTAVALNPNSLTKESYSIIKTKVANPYTRMTGTALPEIDRSSKKLGVTPMELGLLGNTKIEQVFSPNDDVRIANLEASSVKISNFEHGVSLDWEVTATKEADKLDHFIVYRTSGTNEMLTRCHAQGKKFTMKEIVKFAGSVTYVVQPVFVDGKMGQVSTTQLKLA